MITTMTQSEMIEEMNKDLDQYLFFKNGKFSNSKYYKEALKHDKPCTFKPVFWKSKRENNYVITPYSNGKADTRKYKGICLATMLYYYDDHGKLNGIIQSFHTQHFFITSHFFDRYAERFLDDDTLGKFDVMAKFLRRNCRIAFESFDHPKHPNSVIGRGTDGVVIGTIENGITTLKTFITEDMLKGCEIDLANESEKIKKIYDKQVEKFDDLCMLYLNKKSINPLKFI